MNMYMTTNSSFLEQCKAEYSQNFVKVHSGDEGFLKTEDGKELPCKFEAGQFEDGEITLVCDFSEFDLQKCFPMFRNFEKSSVSKVKNNKSSYLSLLDIFLGKFISFNGVSSDKLMNLSGGINFLSEIDNNSIEDHNSERIKIACSMIELTAKTNTNENLQYAEFGITNFKFGDESDKTLSLDIKGVKELIIKKNDNYGDALNFLRCSKGIRVTCNVKVKIDNKTEMKDLEEIICDLCDVMSIALGTRVQWIYYFACNLEGKIVSWNHLPKITKPCYFTEIIYHRDLKNFLESSYEALAEKSNLLRYGEEAAKPLINAYLDAKAENDYLEGRGIKLAVVTEMLKNSLLESEPELEYIINEDDFKELQPTLKTAFKGVFKQSTDPNSRCKFYNNIEGINRTPFKEILHRLCKKINLQVTDDYLQSVVDSRNKLIHEGKFLCESDSKKKKYTNIKEYTQFKDPEHEYYFLMNFVDQCFLKLLHYKGHYYKWKSVHEIKRVELK